MHFKRISIKIVGVLRIVFSYLKISITMENDDLYGNYYRADDIGLWYLHFQILAKICIKIEICL